MKVLIIGGAGMIGRKLSERLARDGELGGKAISSLTLHDVVEGATPAGVLIALDRQERGQGDLSAAQEVTAEFGIPVIAITGLDNVLAYAGERPELSAEHARLMAYRQRYGVAG